MIKCRRLFRPGLLALVLFAMMTGASTASASLINLYVEVRGAIEGWTSAGMDVELELKEVFDLHLSKYREAHAWWMSALEGADDRLLDVERRVEVFAERYGGTSG